jgi:acyl dehydratase
MDVDFVRNWASPELTQTYTAKDTILYGLSMGYGADPLDPDQLAFVYENGLRAVPTMATTLCHPGFWMGDPQTGIDARKVVHGEHLMRFHAPLPTSGTVRGTTRVTAIIDKGADKGAIVLTEREIVEVASGTLIATIEQATMCRGDGGFSGSAPSQAKPAAPQPAPAAPDAQCDVPTLRQAALLYRLTADPNPLHADPKVAAAAGFDRPILHGLCTYGIAARAILQLCCDNQPERLARLSVRFTAPVFPGETIRTEIWRDSDQVQFRCTVPERGVTVISNGIAEVRPARP